MSEKKYKYICNNSGCFIRLTSCPIIPQAVDEGKCFMCGFPMVKMPVCSKYGKSRPNFDAKFCDQCGTSMEEKIFLEPKTILHAIEN